MEESNYIAFFIYVVIPFMTAFGAFFSACFGLFAVIRDKCEEEVCNCPKIVYCIPIIHESKKL